MSGYPQLTGNEAGNGVSSTVEYQNMDNGTPLINAYRRRQCGCQWVFLLVGGTLSVDIISSLHSLVEIGDV